MPQKIPPFSSPQSLKSMLPLRELLALRLCNERPLIWPDTAEPSTFFSWKNFSLSTCFEGGGGIAKDGGGWARASGNGSGSTGRISGRFSLSAGMDEPSRPKRSRSGDRSSSSGTAQAFPFRILLHLWSLEGNLCGFNKYKEYGQKCTCSMTKEHIFISPFVVQWNFMRIISLVKMPIGSVMLLSEV